MRCLLDTHTLIWWWLGAPELSSRARDVMTQSGNEVFVSPVSAIEIGLKIRRGQLLEMTEALRTFEVGVAEDGFVHLPVTYVHARTAGLLPGEHGDPFDRILAAQGLTENLVLITKDAEMASFGCEVIW